MNDNIRIKNSTKNLLSGIVLKIIGILFPFVIKTIIINNLGAEFLGLNSLFTSILTVLSLSELGFGSALVFNMYKPIAQGENKTVCALLNLYKKIYRIIGIIVLIIGIILMPFLPFLINGDLPDDINIYLIFSIYIIDSVISYLFSYKNSILEANQNNSVESLIHSFTNIIMYSSQILVVILIKNYYLYLVMMPICTLLLNIIRNIYVNRKYPQYFCYGKLENEELAPIYKKVKSLIGHKMGTIVITSLDNIVISSFIGLSTLAIYGNYHMIISSLISFITIYYNSILASVGNSLIVDDKEKIYKTFGILNMINFILVGWSSICLLCLYQPFMKIWMGEDMMFPFHTVILFSIYLYTWMIRRIGLTYKDAAGLWEKDFLKPYIGVVVNLIANIILVKVIGVDGVLISTILVMVLIYFPWETRIIFRDLFKSSSRKYYIQMMYFLLITICSAFICVLLTNLINIEGIVGLIFKFLICAIIPLIIYFIALFKMESFRNMLKFIKNIFRRN